MGFENNDSVGSVNEPTTSAEECDSSNQNDSSADYDPSNNGSNDGKMNSNVVNIIPSFRYIYRQDVVKGEDEMIGIVTEIAGDPESDSSTTDDEEDDDDGDEDGDGDDNDNDEDGDGGEDEGDSGEVGDESPNKSGEKNRNSGGFKIGPLPPDQARVLWMDQSESTRSINNLTVIDRGFLHGDFVAAASDPTGQVGVVIDVDIFADMLAHDNSMVKNVSSKELRRVREFAVGDYVVLGSWLGRVDDVLDNVTVLFDDGSVCRVMRADPLRLIPVSKNTLEDGHFPYYPGQRVKASSSVFKNSRWLSGLWRHNRSEGTVTQVTVGSVFIYWIASAGYGPDSATTPAEEQSPKNLKLLSCFAYANWQLGDWCLYTPPLQSSSTHLDKDLAKLELHDYVNGELDSSQVGSGCDSEDSTPEDAIGDNESPNLDTATASFGRSKNNRSNASNESKEPVHETWPLHRKKIRKVLLRRDKKPRKKDEDFERAVIIVNTRTRVDVAWQDGTIECGLSSTSLIPIDNPGDHEFVAEQYVVEKASDNVEDALEPRRVGVVKSVSSKEKTACVRWLKPVSRPEDHREFDNEEIVSVYELEGHPDYDYCHGDVVVRLSPVSIPIESTALKTDSGEQSNQQSASNEGQAHETLEDSSINASESFSDLSWVGNISGLKDGDIEVTWADGMVSTVGPQAIYVVGRDDDDSISAESDVSDDAASWETVEDDDGMVSHENINEEDEHQNTFSEMFSDSEEGRDNNTGRNPALSVPLAAFRFVTRLASGIFSRGQRNSEPLDPDLNDEGEVQAHHEDEMETSKENDCTNENEKSIVIDGSHTETHHSNEEKQVIRGAEEELETEEHLKSQVSDASDSNEVDDSSFKRFDIAVDPLDHYYFGTTSQTNGKRWFKKVQQDWGILQNNLPDGIYVRVYEDRMDLLRAVIVGAYGTPYQDGLFFFDFHLPPEYPDVPPSAYYHSGGWRINPNLYEEGKVCLSLLNTWTGRGNEVWDPKSSSILQVLVSLQGLVLNSKPYFNEAGYEKQVGTAEGEKNSLSYNENTFLLGCKTMMFLMRRPPKDFEELVKEHFKKRGNYILKACDAYMKGHLIGSLTENASLSDKSDGNSTSVGFKLMLAKLVSKLFLALSEIGADCDEFKHLQCS